MFSSSRLFGTETRQMVHLFGQGFRSRLHQQYPHFLRASYCQWLVRYARFPARFTARLSARHTARLSARFPVYVTDTDFLQVELIVTGGRAGCFRRNHPLPDCGLYGWMDEAAWHELEGEDEYVQMTLNEGMQS